MPDVVEVAFKSGCKVYSFDPSGLELNVADQVIVRTSRGIEIGKIVVANHEMPQEEIVGTLEKVVRKATDSDLAAVERNDKLAVRVSLVCSEKIAEYGLDMRLINTEVVFDGGKIIISFFAEERVDFRKLVEDLAKKFRTRIEFRQVGVRDEARLIGGYGPCGRRMCCTMFAGDQQPVSIKMAKEQNLPLNPMKISGICGRLMCCLKYEQEAYKAFKCRCPNKGMVVMTDKGEGRVVDYLVPKEKVLVNLGESGQTEASLEEIEAATQREKEFPREREPEKVAAEAGPGGGGTSAGGHPERGGRPDRGRGRGGRSEGRGGARSAGRGAKPEGGGQKAEGGRSAQAQDRGGARTEAGSAKPEGAAGEPTEAKPGDKSGESTDEKPARRGGRGRSRRRRR
ncbi:MAG: PSP1 domain-containing protein [Thermoleophilia bacterium]